MRLSMLAQVGPVLLLGLAVQCLAAGPGEGSAQLYNLGRWHAVERLDGSHIRLDGRVFAVGRRVLTRTPMERAEIRRDFKEVVAVQQILQLDDSAIYMLRLNEQQDAVDFARALHDDPRVIYAQPDLLRLATEAARPVRGRATALPEAVQALWRVSTGQGVRIALIDDGFDLSHEELRHVRPVLAYDVDRGLLDAAPKLAVDSHGTRVAGLIFGRHDGRGIEGIAPDAELIAIRQADTWTSHLVTAFSIAKLAEADVVNCSWTVDFLAEPVAEAIGELVRRGRAGRGTLVVLSAGNEGGRISEHSALAALPGVVTVGALGAGRAAAFSNRGAHLDLTAPTDLLSVSVGGGYHTFGGTSASAAVVSGTAALVLARHPQLSRAELVAELTAHYPPFAGGAR